MPDSTVGMFQPTAKMVTAAQRKAAKKSRTIISCRVNSAHFEAEGTQEEVLAKFHKFMEDTFERPLKAAINKATKT